MSVTGLYTEDEPRECIDICRSYETSSQQLREICQEEVSAISQSNEKIPPPPEERDKSAASSAPKRMPGTSLNVLPVVRLALTVEFKTTLRWPSKANCLHPVWPRPLNAPYQCMQWIPMMNMLLVSMSRNKSAVEKPDHKEKMLAVMLLNGHRVPLRLDTGATVNIVPEKSFKEVYGEDSLPLLDNAEVILVRYNKTEEKPIGKKRIQVVKPRNGRKYSVEFLVVKGKGSRYFVYEPVSKYDSYLWSDKTSWLFNRKNHRREKHQFQRYLFSNNMLMYSEEKES